LQALAFFGKPLPREALEILFDSKPQAAQAISRLGAHRLAMMTEDARRTKYYELHAYFREQARKVLAPFENLDETALEQYAANLAFTKGNEAYNKAYFRRAGDLYECAEKIYCFLCERKGRADLENNLAAAYLNKGVALQSSGHLAEALTVFDKAILIRERLVNDERRGELANDLAMAYMNKALVLENKPDWENALACYKEAIRLRIKCIDEFGRIEILPDLMQVVTYRFDTLFKLSRLNEAAQDGATAIRLLQDYLEHPELSEHFKEQTLGYFGRIIGLLRQASDANREEIYQAGGEYGEVLRQLVEGP
jgi:tetratricopeptide (TPR) repeat protein